MIHIKITHTLAIASHTHTHTHTHTKQRERGKCYNLNSTKYVQDWYEENYKTDENTFKDLNKQRNLLYLWIEKWFNILKVTIITQLIHRLKANFFWNLKKAFFVGRHRAAF